SNENSHHTRVELFIKNDLAKYIRKITEFKGHLISIDFYFKNIQIRLLQIYFSIQEKKQLKTEVYNKILELIKETKHKLILIGDFNSVSNPLIDRFLAKKLIIPENDLLKYF